MKLLMKNDKKIIIVCANCQNSRVFYNPIPFIENKLTDKIIKINNIAELNTLFFKFLCSKCNKRIPEIYLNDDLLFDINNLKLCINCNLPISLSRLKTFPDTNICTANCVDQIDKSANIVPPTPTIPESKRVGKCGHIMDLRFGPFGWFLGCTKYPSCKNTDNLD